MKNKFLLIIILTLLLSRGVTNSVCFAQKRSESVSSQQRTKIAEIARLLETDPLNTEAKKARKWFMKWVKEETDLNVSTCSRLFDSATKSKDNYMEELNMQIALSSAAFMIEHPDQIEDRDAVLREGIRGLLRAYEAILKVKPQARWPALDALIEKRSRDSSYKYVRDVMAICSIVPLSDRNKNSYQVGEPVYAPIEVTQRAKIKEKPAPGYTQEAQVNGVYGTVELEAVLASSGMVSDIRVIKGLPAGLTELAIRAASRIKFEPAIKNNRHVSTLVRLEYNFHP